MDSGLSSSELPVTLSMVPGYGQVFVAKQLWMIVACQVFVCVTSSIWVSYYFYRKFYALGEMSWKKAVEIMGPISKRLQNLEKERTVWHCYLEWIEDYCTVYYGLLNYLNTAATDLDKICQNKSFSWKNLSDSSGPISQTDGRESPDDDKEIPSETERIPSVGPKVFTSLGKVVSNVKVIDVERMDVVDGSKDLDSMSGMSWDLNSIAEDLDSKKGTGDEASSEVPEPDSRSPRKRRKRTVKRG